MQQVRKGVRLTNKMIVCGILRIDSERKQKRSTARRTGCIVTLIVAPAAILYLFFGTAMLYTLAELPTLLLPRPTAEGIIAYVDETKHVHERWGKWIKPEVYIIEGKKKPRLLVREDLDAGHEFRYGPAISRHGKMVAYVLELTDYWRQSGKRRTEWGYEEPVYELVTENVNRRIFVAGVDGAHRRDLSRGRTDDIDPEWSPDGKLIAFSSGARKLESPRYAFARSSVPPDRHQIWVMDADGGNRRQITNLPTQCFHPTWSPDGKQIAFVAAVPFAIPTWVRANIMMLEDVDRWFYCDLWVIDSDGTNARQLTRMEEPKRGWDGWTAMMDFPSAWEPHWSPVGHEIVFVYRDQLYLCDARTKQLRRLTKFNPQKEYDHPMSPCWSPDGEHICFAYHRYAGHVPFTDSYKSKTDLYLINKDGSRLKRITRTHSARQPSWGARYRR